MGFKVACCEESRWVTRGCLERTGETRMIIIVHHAHGCTLVCKRIRESMTRNRRKHPLIQDQMPRGLAHLMASRRVTTKLNDGSRSVGVEASEDNLQRILTQCRHVRQTAGLEKCGRRRGDFFSKESPHNSLSVNPGLVALCRWKETMLVPRGGENQHAMKGICSLTRHESGFLTQPVNLVTVPMLKSWTEI